MPAPTSYDLDVPRGFRYDKAERRLLALEQDRTALYRVQ